MQRYQLQLRKGINRNIVECKGMKLLEFAQTDIVLIET